jgi:hypothetical protein
MPRPHEVRTFIHLKPRELDFVRTLQRLVQKRSGRKKPPSMQRVIQGALLDYKRLLELVSIPDFLIAYDRAKAYKHRSPANEVGQGTKG